MVKETTAAIWVSHKGMSEAELLKYLDVRYYISVLIHHRFRAKWRNTSLSLQVPNAVWSPFYLSLIENLVNRNGILNFFHDHLRKAVELRYLPTAEDKKRAYSRLADFFAACEVNDRAVSAAISGKFLYSCLSVLCFTSQVDELPFLLARAGELDRLKTTISDLEVFRRLAKSEDGRFDLIKYWKMVVYQLHPKTSLYFICDKNGSSLFQLGDFSDVETAYLDALKNLPEATLADKEGTVTLKQNMAEFFMELGLYGASRWVSRSFSDAYYG